MPSDEYEVSAPVSLSGARVSMRATSNIPDNGQRQETFTGAQREVKDGKGRYDLISPIAYRRLAVRYEQGGKKYADRDWEKGRELSTFIDSALRHLNDARCAYIVGDGEVTEDHLAAAAWQIFAWMHTEELIRRGLLPAELDDQTHRNDGTKGAK